jgi:hypothetical protein
MRIFCLCVVKNEGDVLEESIRAAARWSDGIFIADNGSDDDTPAIIDRLATRHSNVFNAGPITEPFTDDMRGKVFRRVSGVSRRGDWWCKLDADEFFIDDPKEFIARLPRETDTVWGSFFTFYFTEDDLRRYESDPARFLATPTTERLRHYRNNESEIRLVKHTFPLIWYNEWPRFRCAASPQRIRVAHYRYRSPEQILRRLGVRRQVAARTRGGLFPHEMGRFPTGVAMPATSADSGEGEAVGFRERVIPAAGLDSLDAGWVSRESELRPVTDVRPKSVPFWLWKPICILKALLNIQRYVPSRVKRLIYGRG